MTTALYQRFRPVAAFREMVARRRIRGDLLAERDASIESLGKVERQYRLMLDWNVCQSQNIGECHRQIEALRAATVRMLWQAIADGHRRCDCGANVSESVCDAWRALGFEGHFDADKAADLLPLVKP